MSKNNGGKDYDVMDPTSSNPNASAAKKQGINVLAKALKSVGKAIVKLGKSIVSKLVAIGPVGWIILAIIIVILIIATILISFNVMPGMMKKKLTGLFEIDTSNWFMLGAVSNLDSDYEDIKNVSNYLESMDYSLVGYGFVTPKLNASDETLTSDEITTKYPEYTYKADSDGKYHYYDASGNIVKMQYYDSTGKTIDNSTGEESTTGAKYTDKYGIIRSSDGSTDTTGNKKGKVAEIKEEDLKQYRLLRSYLLSDYRIYTLKNTDEDFLKKFAEKIRTISGNDDGWAKGLIKLYNAENGIATKHWWWGKKLLGETATIDRTNLTLKKGWFNNAIQFSLEGWAPRYGMSFDFLVSLHLGTNAPELVNAMLQNFDTEIQVYLDDSGASKITARYVDPQLAGKVAPNNGTNVSDLELVMNATGNKVAAALSNDLGAFQWLGNNIAFNGKVCQDLLMYDKATKEAAGLTDSYAADTARFLAIMSPDTCINFATKGTKCSDDTSLTTCCSECQKYVKAVFQALAAVSDRDFKSYTPYIARVLGSWFRDTYFIVPNEADVAIKEYAGGLKLDARTTDGGETEKVMTATNHPEYDIANSFGEDVKFVKVDEEYLGDSGQYWTKYEMKTDDSGNDTDEYQLYLLKSDGTTSDVKMEDFLADGKLADGTQATVGGTAVTGYASKEAAEKDGWAFVKKAKLMGLEDLKNNKKTGTTGGTSTGSSSGSGGSTGDGKVLWSAYEFNKDGSTSDWKKVERDGTNSEVDKLYDLLYGAGNSGDDSSGIFYQESKANSVTQIEDAQRAPTNSLVKYLFKYRQFYIYDGGENRAVQIEHDKKRVLYGYSYYSSEYDSKQEYYNGKVVADEYDIRDAVKEGKTRDTFYQYEGLINKDGTGGLLSSYYGGNWKSKVVKLLNKYGRSAIRDTYSVATDADKIDAEDLASQWLEWQLDMFYMDKYGVKLEDYYRLTGGKAYQYQYDHNDDKTEGSKDDLLKLKYDPRDPDLVSTVEITKSSLSVFSILENTGTLDADYAYRDFKELIVELDYFNKEDLSEKIQKVFTWILPEVDPTGWPNRPWDKLNVDYGTLVQSKDTYEALGMLEEESGADSGAGTGTGTDAGAGATPGTGTATATGTAMGTGTGTGTPAPEGTGTESSSKSSDGFAFKGYEEDQKVVSPVTGRILEIGKHQRLNVYTGAMEEVEFIKIQVMDSENYFDSIVSSNSKLDLSSASSDAGTGTGTGTGSATTPTQEYKVSDGLNLFYKEYKDVCDGYTIMIDGFDVDLGSDPEGEYEQNKVYALYNTKEMQIRQEREQAKAAAPFIISNGESGSFPGDTYTADLTSLKGYYIKEGKTLGKTIVGGGSGGTGTGTTTSVTTPIVTAAPGGVTGGTSTLPEKLTYTYADFANVPGDYIRMVIQDTDYALVDDVERFFDIPEPIILGGSGITASGDSAAQVEAVSAELGVAQKTLPSDVNKYWEIIKKYSAEYGLDPYLVRALMAQESSGDINCSGAAIGLMQWELTNGDPNITFTDASGNKITVKTTISAMKGNADEQIKVGCAELKRNLDRCNGNVPAALTAYNNGFGGLCVIINHHLNPSSSSTNTGNSSAVLNYLDTGDTSWLTDGSRQWKKDHFGGGDPKYVENVMKFYNTSE